MSFSSMFQFFWPLTQVCHSKLIGSAICFQFEVTKVTLDFVWGQLSKKNGAPLLINGVYEGQVRRFLGSIPGLKSRSGVRRISTDERGSGVVSGGV